MPPQQATQQPDFIPATAAPDFIPAEQSDTTPLEKQGAMRRFATRLMGVPDRLFDHPGDYLNPFSRGYWDTAKKEREAPPMMPTMDMPGKQTIQDVKARNYAGAVGDVLPEAYAFGSMAIPAAGRMMQRPSVARMVPQVGRYAGGAVGAEVGKALDHPYAGAVAGAGAGEVAGRALVKMAPKMARSVIVSTGEPIPPEETTPLPPPKRFTPAEEPPVSERGVYMKDPRTGEQILQAAKDNLGGGQGKVAMQEPKPAEAAPAPYRMRGPEIKDAVTVTPRKVLGPERMLPAPKMEEPPPVEMQPLKAKTTTGRQAEVLKKSGIAAPKATMQAPDQIPSGDLLPDPKATFKGANSGEAALRQQLTDLKGPSQINKLRAIAVQRGIKVGPKDTNEVLIGKIADSATPDEVEAFEQARIERIQPDYSPARMGEPTKRMQSPEESKPMSSGADLIEALQQMKKAAAAKK